MARILAALTVIITSIICVCGPRKPRRHDGQTHKARSPRSQENPDHYLNSSSSSHFRSHFRSRSRSPSAPPYELPFQMNSNTAIAMAQLAIYAVLALPTVYVLFLHGSSGFLGWFYLLVFGTLRIVGGAMLLHNPLSTGATTITSIGISPLLLATLGILHEV